MFIEIVKFFIYSILIVLISKFILVKALRNLAEKLNLNSRIVGNIAGIATSIPELLTVSVASFKGLIGTSFYNIISSNIINVVQYFIAIVINKNYKEIKNNGIVVQLILVILTIIIPIVLIKLKNSVNIILAVILIILYFIFLQISKKSYHKYLKKEEMDINEELNKEIYEEKNKQKGVYLYIIMIIVAGILLYFIGDKLGIVLENLANMFGVAEYILGILLGFVTSIPELVTFFESQKHYKKQKDKEILGVIEATNNLLTSNILNLFVIQAIGIVIYNLIL